MAVRRLSAEGAAPAGVAWERYAVIGAWPTWSPQIRRVEADHLVSKWYSPAS